MKICIKCHQEKDEVDFGIQHNGHLLNVCKQCISIRRKNQRHLHKLQQSDFKKMYRYGISTQEYLDLFKLQKGMCKICGKQTENLVIDHDHVSLAIRGLLCRDCNISLGGFKDDVSILRRAIDYLINANTKTTLQQHLMQMLRK